MVGLPCCVSIGGRSALQRRNAHSCLAGTPKRNRKGSLTVFFELKPQSSRLSPRPCFLVVPSFPTLPPWGSSCWLWDAFQTSLKLPADQREYLVISLVNESTLFHIATLMYAVEFVIQEYILAVSKCFGLKGQMFKMIFVGHYTLVSGRVNGMVLMHLSFLPENIVLPTYDLILWEFGRHFSWLRKA